VNRLRDPHWLLIVIFLGIIAGVPLVQAVLEVRRGEEVGALAIFAQPPSSANLRAYERTLEAANWAARLGRPWVHFAQFAWLRDGGDKVALGRDDWLFYRPGVQYLLGRTDGAATNGAPDDPLPAIVDFRDQLAARGIRLLVMPVPNKESIYPDRLTRRAAGWHGALAPRTAELLRRLRAADVEVLDLFTEFTRARATAEANDAPNLYLAQDTHWSPAGVDLAARAAARRLVELGWTQPGATDYATHPAPARRLGDIVQMLQVPALERRMAREAVPCVQVVRGDTGEAYRDAADAEVLLLGDSFLRIYQEDEPGAAGFIAHLATHLRQPLLAVVNDGGGSTLVRRELFSRPAFLRGRKVVLWEFVERDIGLGLEGWQKVPLPPDGGPYGRAGTR
jgi:hypothetical protein